MRTLRIVLDVEFSDLPDEVREDLADGLNFRADEDREVAPDLDAVPRIAEMSDDEIVGRVSEFFDGLSEYAMQEELWAGTGVFGYLSSVKTVDVAITA